MLQFGLRRDLDTGNKFMCSNGYTMKGKPFAVFKSPGEWKVLFNCTPAKGKLTTTCNKNKTMFTSNTNKANSI